MDIFSFFRPSPERQIEKARKRVKERHGDPATRINAARRLLEMGTRESLLAVLDRFTISASPSRRDEEEKDELVEWLVEMGPRMVEPIMLFLKRERQVYWPVRVLKEILSEEEFQQKINEVLTHHWEYPPASPDPKAQLIRAIKGVSSPEIDETVGRYFEDDDDDVLVATLDHYFELPEERAREGVLETYLRCADRPRIRNHILERLVEKGWSVKGFRPRVEETLPEGYILTRDGVLKTMGRRI
jgi:hypothetical protein